MLANFSVKKPFTILVAVVLVVVLGLVSFNSMTPDLLPRIDLPYIMVMTSYAGATPEEVETTISQPMEALLNTLDNVESISSTSSENYSLVTLAFSENADLENAALAVREKISPLTSSWDDEISTPTILKLSPDMLPVNVAAVSYEGMDTIVLSRFVKDTLLPALEGTDGIADVSASGLVSERIDVEIDPQKIASINQKLISKVLESVNEQKSLLDDQRAELEDQLQKLSDTQTELSNGKETLIQESETAAAQLVQTQSQLNSQKSALQKSQTLLNSQIADAKAQVSQLDANISNLQTLQNKIAKAEASLKDAQNTVSRLSPYSSSVVKLNTMKTQKENSENALTALGYSKEEAQKYLREQSNDYQNLLEAISQLEASIASTGVSPDQLPDSLNKAKNDISVYQSTLSSLDASLASQNLTRDSLSSAIARLQASRKTASSAQKKLEKKNTELNYNQSSLDKALNDLLKQKSNAESQLNNAMMEIEENEKNLILTRSNLETALEELNKGYEQLNQAEKEALKNADISNKVTFSALAQLIGAQNFSMPAGYVDDKIVGVKGELENIDALSNLLLFTLDDVGDVRLSDVASIALMNDSQDIYARINQTDGILLSFSRQSDVATVTASENLDRQMRLLEKEYEGLTFYSLMDQGDYIHIVVRSVLENLILGAVLAIIILFLFLRDIRPTIMVALSIPLSVMLAIVLMYFSGVTLNIISLSGLAVGVGMLVDNSIVVIENIYRLRSRGLSPIKAAVNGTSQIVGAIVSSTLTTICVFLPFVFIQGLTRKLFTDMALTIAYALLASLLVSVTLIPCVASGTLKKIRPPKHGYRLMLNVYERLLTRALHYKWAVLALALLLLLSSGLLAFSRGFDYMPDMEGTEIMVNLKMPEDSTLENTAAVSDKVISRIQEIEGVKTVGAMAGSGIASALGLSGGSKPDPTNVSMYVLLEENAPVSMRRMAEEIEALTADLPCTLSASSTNSMSSYSSALGGNGVSISLYSQDLDQLTAEARKIASIVQTVEGIETVSDGLEQSAPALHVSIDHNAAASLGLTVAQIYADITTALTRSITVSFLKNPPVDICIVNPLNLTAKTLRDYELTINTNASDTESIRLGDIAEISEGTALASIHRSEQRRTLSVTASLADGYNITHVSNAVQEALNQQYTAPSGLTLVYSGESESINDALKDLAKVLGLGILLVYLIMVAQFQSLLSPFIVMFAVPLAFTGGLLALFFCGFEISVVSSIGFIILVGIVVNNGIVLVDTINHMRNAGIVRKNAILEAGRMRIRPILMTALTTILGLLPMALSLGVGSSLIQPIAIVGIGGLTYATFMTLFIIPILYDIFHKNSPDHIVFRKLDTSSAPISDPDGTAVPSGSSPRSRKPRRHSKSRTPAKSK